MADFPSISGGSWTHLGAGSVGHVMQQEAGHPRFLHRFGSNVGGVPVWKKWALAMNGFDHSEIRSAESVNGAKTGP